MGLFIIAGLFTLLGILTGQIIHAAANHLPKILLSCDESQESSDIFPYFFKFSAYFRSRKSIFLSLAMGLLFGGSSLIFPLSVQFFFVLAAVSLLVCCIITDFEHGILPDQFTIPLVWLGLLGSLAPVFIAPKESILGAAGGYGVFWLFNALYRRIRGMDGMYPGDFKLNAAVGALAGFQWLIAMIFISLPLIIVVETARFFLGRKKKSGSFLYHEAPFGCFLSLVAIGALYLLLFKQM